MPESILTIKGKVYSLEEVELTGEHHVDADDGEDYVTFNLATVGEDPDKDPGLAINCITLRGLSTLGQLQNRTFSIDEKDHLNDLYESVIWEPGTEVMMVMRLVVRFGKIANQRIEVQIETVCSDFSGEEEEWIDVTGRLRTRIGSFRA